MAKLPGPNRIPRAKPKRGIQPEKFSIIPPTTSTQVASEGMSKMSRTLKVYSDKIEQVDALRQTTDAKTNLQKEINEIKNAARGEQDPDALALYEEQIANSVARSGENIRGIETAARVDAISKQMGVVAEWDLQNTFYKKKITAAENSIRMTEISQMGAIVESDNRLFEKQIMYGTYEDYVNEGLLTPGAAAEAKKVWAKNVSKEIFRYDLRTSEDGPDYAVNKLASYRSSLNACQSK